MAAMHVKHAAGASVGKMAPFGAETAAPQCIKTHITFQNQNTCQIAAAIAVYAQTCQKNMPHSTQLLTLTSLTHTVSYSSPPLAAHSMQPRDRETSSVNRGRLHSPRLTPPQTDRSPHKYTYLTWRGGPAQANKPLHMRQGESQFKTHKMGVKKPHSVQ